MFVSVGSLFGCGTICQGVLLLLLGFGPIYFEHDDSPYRMFTGNTNFLHQVYFLELRYQESGIESILSCNYLEISQTQLKDTTCKTKSF